MHTTPHEYFALIPKIREQCRDNSLELWIGTNSHFLLGNDWLAEEGSCLEFNTLLDLVNWVFQ